MPMSDYAYNKPVKMNAKDSFETFNRVRYYESTYWYEYKDKSLGNRQFYYGDQLDDETITKMQERGQYPIVINRIRKAINSIAGLLTANMPEFKCVAAGVEDDKKAEFASRILKYIWHNNKGLEKWRRCVLSAIRDNIGYILVEQNEKNETDFVNLSVEDVIVDPGSKDSLFRDAEYVYVVRWVSVDKASREYGIPKDQLTLDTPAEWVQYQNEQGFYTYVNKIFSTDRQFVKVYMGFKKVCKPIYRKLPNGEQIYAGKEVRIEKETIIGYHHVYKEKLPEKIQNIPLIPVFSENTENPYKLGEIHFLKEYQKLVNKSFGVMLLNAQLNSNPKVFVWEHTIPDEDKDYFQDNYATPGSINRLAGDGRDGSAPITVQGQPLNTAWYQMVQFLLTMMEQATIPQELQGYRDSADKQFSSQLLQQREAVMDSFKMLISQIDTSLSQLGQVALEFFSAYTHGEKVLKVTSAGKVLEQIEVNFRAGLDANDEQSVKAYVEQEVQKGRNIYEVDKEIAEAKDNLEYAKGLGEIINDTAAINVDVYVVPGSYNPSYSMAKFDLKKDLYQMGVVDNESVLENAPIDNKEQTLNRVSQNKNLIATVEEQKQLIEQLQSEIQGMRQSLYGAQVNQQLTENKARADKTIANDMYKRSADRKVNNMKQHMRAQDVIHELELQTAKLEGKQEAVQKELEDAGQTGVLYELGDMLKTK